MEEFAITGIYLIMVVILFVLGIYLLFDSRP